MLISDGEYAIDALLNPELNHLTISADMHGVVDETSIIRLDSLSNLQFEDGENPT